MYDDRAAPVDLSDYDLQAIERRCDAATAGPWSASVEGRDHQSGDDFIRTGAGGDPDLYLSHHAGSYTLRPAPVPDLAFIAAARQDVPRLVAEVRRLREQWAMVQPVG